MLTLSNREEESHVLELGPLSVIPDIIKKVVPGIESETQTTTDAGRGIEVRKLFNKPIKPAYKELTIIKRLKQDQNVILIQTDKSNKLATLHREDCNR